MPNILDQLSAYSAIRAERDKEAVPISQLLAEVGRIMAGTDRATDFRFEKALRRKGLSFICEIKKASPSKGLIDPEFKYLDIAAEYEDAGADCISCLTEPKWFLGSDSIFKEVRKTVSIPMIRKDFTVDEYQIYQAKAMGADAVLLICSCLDKQRLKQFLRLCDDLGLSALTETHDKDEIQTAAELGARVIGVNNRNLKSFDVDTGNSLRLKEYAPQDCVFVSESGVKTADDIRKLKAAGIDAVLIGETMMRAADKKALLKTFREA